MKRLTLTALMLSTLVACSEDEKDTDPNAAIDLARGGYQCATMTTSMGDLVLALDERKAPKTVANFKQYMDQGFYDGLLFHRVMPNFMIQGGGFETNMEQKQPHAPIENESTNGLKNYRGRIAMARTNQPHSATSQFFINAVDNSFLNREDARDGWGYAVFGGVISGMDVVDRIQQVETKTVDFHQNVPVQEIFINSLQASECPSA